jgi:hypothetical protein
MSPDKVSLGQFDHRVVQRRRVFEEHEQRAQAKPMPESEA